MLVGSAWKMVDSILRRVLLGGGIVVLAASLGNKR
jgi:hypothetical protein